MREPFRLNGVTVNPGQRYHGTFDLIELSDGRSLSAPLMIAHGVNPGPTVFIGAGIHGDEINGIRTAIEAMRQIDPVQLSGTILCVPVQNPQGYRSRRRLLMFNEQERKLNMHQAFPGHPGGEPAERAAHRILDELILQTGCKFMFDLHTGTSTFFCALHSFVASSSYGETASQALTAASVADLGLVVQTNSGVYAAVDMPHMVLGEKGIPVLGMELGAGGRYEAGIVQKAAQGVVNVLRHLDLLPGAKPAAKPQAVLSEVFWVRADRGGLFRPKAELGAHVTEGQVLGDMFDLFGRPKGQVIAPVSGYIISLIGVPTLNEGEAVARIGVPA